MTINVQSRAAGGEWQVRNAFLTENAKVKAGSMQRGELLRLATQTMQGWRSYEDGRQLRVYDSAKEPKSEPKARAKTPRPVIYQRDTATGPFENPANFKCQHDWQTDQTGAGLVDLCLHCGEERA